MSFINQHITPSRMNFCPPNQQQLASRHHHYQPAATRMPPQKPKATAAMLLPLLLALTSVVSAQKIGTQIPEVHPRLQTQFCTTTAGCATRTSQLVTDALSRPLHASGPSSSAPCPAGSLDCELEGISYSSIGVLTSGSALTMRQYLFDGTSYKSVSPRLYLLAEDGMQYEMLKLRGQELSYDVDVSQLGCGMNGALYLSEMESTGGRSDANPAGAQYGTGYCDAQCFNTSYIGGLPNTNNSGSCCNEMDIWEANSQATALTPHTCSKPGPFLCSGDECGKSDAVGVCDKSGCGINPFSTGDKSYYGPGLTVDTSRPFTVVTQFITSDNTTTSPLTEIRRLYVQDGKVIPNAGVSSTTSVESQYATRADEEGEAEAAGAGGAITQDFCTARNASSFLRLGGVAGMGDALGRGMVLVFSIWNSDGDFMNWLDSGSNGPCSSTAGDPKGIVAQNPEVSVTFSNIRWGDVGATFNATTGTGTAGGNGTGAAGAGGVVNAAKLKSEGMRTGMGVGMKGLAWGMGIGMAGIVFGWLLVL